jgi:calcineurin-like phosphoesterase family protein
MDAAMIDAWNSVVSARDIVLHLGDFAYKTDKPRMQKIFDRLSGEKHLVAGNHDHSDAKGLGWASVSDIREIKVAGERIILCHFPLREWPHYWHGALHLFGHTHGRMQGSARALDVGVDSVGYAPVDFDSIKRRMNLMPELSWEYGHAREPEDVATADDGDLVGLKI